MNYYKAKAETQTYKGVKRTYPVIEFYAPGLGFNTFHINSPQPTRSKALTIAKNYIKNLQK